MRSNLPPYGNILREAIKTRDVPLMKAYLDYSTFVMSHADGVSAEHLADWKSAHDQLEKALG